MNEGEPFKLRLRKDTVWYRVKELEAILKEINEIADMALKNQASLEPSLVKAARQRYDALLEIRGLSNV